MCDWKAKFQNQAAHKSESPGVLEWVSEKVKFAAVWWREKRKKYQLQLRPDYWSKEVCHARRIGQIIICSVREEKNVRADWAEGRSLLRCKFITAPEMSFPHEEQEFDFSYVFEYGQGVQLQPEPGG